LTRIEQARRVRSSRTSAGANIKRPGRRTVKCAISCACVTAARDNRKICAVAPAMPAAVLIAPSDAATAGAISLAMRATRLAIAMQPVALAIVINAI
jgi:hypothetical protein